MRSESLYFLFSPVSRIKGIGSKMSETFARLLPAATRRDGGGLPLVRDVLFHLPVGVIDRRVTFPLREAPDGVVATFIVTIDSHHPPANKRFSKKPYQVICSNETGTLTLAFFNAGTDYLKKTLPVGEQRVVSGTIEHFDGHVQMPHPDIIAPVYKLEDVQKLEPVYPLTAGLTSKRIAMIVDDIIKTLPELAEWQEKPVLAFKQALIAAHHPETPEEVLASSPAHMRLAYDEILAHQLSLALLRRKMQAQPGIKITGNKKLSDALIAKLPYQLTNGQKQVLADIASDMASGRRMTRMLQGDVGSGKTIVSLLAMLAAVEEGYQCALMVPTELVARQHYEVISKLVALLKPSPLEGEGRVRGYPSKGLDNAKELRINQTDAEKKLWALLRDKQLEGCKFRRQQPIDSYVADFFCAEKKLIVELDGGQHADQEAYDAKRTAFLEAEGYRVLRFWNNDVMENIEGVWETIVQSAQTPHPSPLPQGEREVVILTGSVKGKEREEVLAKIASGDAKIIIGTHALFQEHVVFKNLALVVVDEQHRFGVNQRLALTQKGNAPHILHMTATPIPRSLSMLLYGDMESSLLKEKPAGRTAIATRLIPKSRNDEVLERLKAALDRGEKAYWICPLVEDSESELAAATTRHKEFLVRFGPMVGLMHGRMKGQDRDAEMQRFARGDIKLLVATTVVEVGVDVKDATIMVIEEAQRFGLSQLHQLRGRVGRGDKQSACVLLYSGQGAEESAAMARLGILRETEDGFRIAETDLQLRGAGELLGVRQSGMEHTIFIDFNVHTPLIEKARDEAKNLLISDPELQSERGKAAEILLQLFEREVN